MKKDIERTIRSRTLIISSLSACCVSFICLLLSHFASSSLLLFILSHFDLFPSLLLSSYRDNISKTLERGERLEEMEEKADVLERSGREFHKNAVRLRRKFCMSYWRLTFLILVIIAIIIVVIVFAIKGKD